MKLKPVYGPARKLYGYSFPCPGCGHPHVFYVSGLMTWTFDGNMEAPTFTPSLLNSCDTHINPKLRRCHLNLTAGKLQFHPDCTHGLAGQTVDMLEQPDVERPVQE